MSVAENYSKVIADLLSSDPDAAIASTTLRRFVIIKQDAGRTIRAHTNFQHAGRAALLATSFHVSLRSLAKTSVAAGGLGKECTLGRKLHFSL